MYNLDIHEKYRYIIMVTSLGHCLHLRFRESDKREGGRVGQDSLVKQDAVHGSCEVQLHLLSQSIQLAVQTTNNNNNNNNNNNIISTTLYKVYVHAQ